MEQFTETLDLGQLESSEAAEIFRQYLRGVARQAIIRVMAEEVAELCGVKHRPPADAACRRAGSAPGVVLHEGRRERVSRPRVRRAKGDGTTEEIRLATYAAAQESGHVDQMLVAAMIAGVSGREMEHVHPESPRTSKSSVSRLWAKEGARLVDELRDRDIRSHTWVVLMLDGIRLSKDQLAVAAIGITADGRKVFLDFELGSSENLEVCRDLVSRLVTRGFAVPDGLLAVLDGADALKTAVLAFFPHAVVQRCVIHKERNIRGRLSRRDWGDNARLFKRLREVQGEAAGREAYRDLERFLEGKNAAALASLREAGDELIALHLLEVPSTLHPSLLSTNIIENSFLNTRRKLGRVTRFRAETDQASRWLAMALLEAERGFRRIDGYRDLPHLVEALRRREEALRQREAIGREGPRKASSAAPTADAPRRSTPSPLRPPASTPPPSTASNP